MDNLIGILNIFVQNEDTLERAIALNLLPGFLFYYLEHLDTGHRANPRFEGLSRNAPLENVLGSWLRERANPAGFVDRRTSFLGKMFLLPSGSWG